MRSSLPRTLSVQGISKRSWYLLGQGGLNNEGTFGKPLELSLSGRDNKNNYEPSSCLLSLFGRDVDLENNRDWSPV